MLRFIGKISAVISLITAFIIIPALCIVEYLTRIKMGMYRYVFMKNARLFKEIFTPEYLPIMLAALLIIFTAGIYLEYRRRHNTKSAKKLIWQVYGALLTLSGIYLFWDYAHFASLRAAPWFGIAVLVAEALWFLRTVFYF